MEEDLVRCKKVVRKAWFLANGRFADLADLRRPIENLEGLARQVLPLVRLPWSLE
jgi:hypothetical protein